MDVIAHIFKYLKKAIEENIEPVKLKDHERPQQSYRRMVNTEEKKTEEKTINANEVIEMQEKEERQTVTVKEFIGTLESSDRLRIIEGKAEVYVGYLAAFKPFADHEISEEYRKYSGHEVKKFRAVPEITHRRWKELGLMKPLEPDQTAQYKFSDLQMSLYYTIYI